MSGKKPVQQPQPPKLPKQQNLVGTSQAQNPSKLVPITPSQIVPLSQVKSPSQDNLVSPSNIANHYLVSTIPKPNYKRPPYGQPSYSSALASPAPKATNPYLVEEPFGPIQTQKPSYPTRKGNSSYVKKSFLQHISYIEPHLGHHPSELRILKNYRSPSGLALYYSYYDYIDAFEKVLFIQNQNYNHSWFLMFSKDFFGQLPSWFLKWWEMFGSIPQIFPEPLQDALRYFDSRYKTSSHRSQFPVILLFSQRFRIHWISKWDYKINANLLDREFSVKWWDNLRIDQIINQVYKDYPPPIQQPIAHRTRSQSSLNLVQITEKSSKELKELAQQLMAHSQQLESEEQVSPSTSVASVNHNPIDPLQDSQDPYSGYNLDSD
ncbi:hypothetical protein ACB092_11G175600 [Castanea dentata]